MMISVLPFLNDSIVAACSLLVLKATNRSGNWLVKASENFESVAVPLVG